MTKGSVGRLDQKRKLIEILDEKGTFIQRLGFNVGKIHFISYPEAFFLFNHNLLSVNHEDFRLYSINSIGTFMLFNCYSLLENGITCSSKNSEAILINPNKTRTSKSNFLGKCLVHNPELNFFRTMEEINGLDNFVSINIPQCQIFFCTSQVNLIDIFL